MRNAIDTAMEDPIAVDLAAGSNDLPQTDTSDLHIMAHPSPAVYRATDEEAMAMLQVLTSQLAVPNAYPAAFADPILVGGVASLITTATWAGQRHSMI